MHLTLDPLVDELRRLAPEVSVSGGSFAHWLPNPKNIPSVERGQVLDSARRDATRKCLTDILASAGLPAIEPSRLASGARKWPVGYMGSVSHKGTKVAAALIRIGEMRSIGIDIETLDRDRELSEIKGLNTSDELPPGLGTAGSVILLSVKEAVYKALSPVLGIRFGWKEVQVSWKEIAPRRISGVALFDRFTVEIRCSTAVPSWVGSVALMSPQPGLPRFHVRLSNPMVLDMSHYGT